MNIFVLDENPEIAAKYHNDKHVVKMILETAQLLNNAYPDIIENYPINLKRYKKTHHSHPCSIWASQSLKNWNWLAQLGINLCKEYTHRYNKIHKTQSIIEWMIKNPPFLQDIELTQFKQAMPDNIKNEDVVIAYRNYYNTHKRHIAKWTNREIPKWWLNEL